LLEYLTGVALVAAGLCIASNIRARLAELSLGNWFLFGFLILWIPRLAGNPFGVSDRTCALETLVICGAALTLAGYLPVGRRDSNGWSRAENTLIASGPFLFAISVVFGVDQ
jgi:hypothetical protein